MAKMSMRELARITGYSPATVSNALNGRPGVSPETAEEIRRMAEEHGYIKTPALASVRFVVARNANPMIAEGDFSIGVMNGLERECQAHNTPMGYATLDLADPVGRERQASHLFSDPAVGVVLLGTYMEEADYDLVAQCPCPLVVVDGVSNRHFVESVVFSNEGSSYRAVRHLIEWGHRRIGYIGGSHRVRNFRIRERGYRNALAEAGLKALPQDRAIVGSDCSSMAAADMERWLRDKDDLPSAFFADNDAIALGAVQALTAAGLDVPNDVSVVGFDDMEYASLCQPPLTTVHVPVGQIGRMCYHKLAEQVGKRPEYTCATHISTRIVDRASVADLRRPAPRGEAAQDGR